MDEKSCIDAQWPFHVSNPIACQKSTKKSWGREGEKGRTCRLRGRDSELVRVFCIFAYTSVSLFSFPARPKLTFSHSPCRRIQTPKVTVNLHCKAVSLSFGWLEQEQPEVLQEEKTQRGGGRGLSRGTHTVLFPDLNHVIFLGLNLSKCCLFIAEVILCIRAM